MKKVFLSLLSACFILASHAEQAANADDVIKAATAKAKKEKKNVMVIFHASWCVWCRRMDASVNDPSIKKYFDNNYVITHLVVDESKGKEHLENPGGKKFLEKMGGKNEGLPYWVILSSEGEKLADSKMGRGDNTGCPATAAEVAHFRIVLKNTSSLTDTELSVISKRFRKNE